MKEYLDKIEFLHPDFFYLLLLIPIFIVWYILRNKRRDPAMSYSTFSGLSQIKPSLRQQLRHILFVIRMLAFAMLVIALARPRSSERKEEVTTEGVDIVLTLDVSASMLAEDFRPNRIGAAKENAIDFIEKREHDRVGVVLFAAESFTLCPLTIDHKVANKMIDEIESGMINDNGTLLGVGLANAVARLKDSKAKSKVIILLTDGVDQRVPGKLAITPLTAADIAKTYGIKVYTIGVGTRGKARYPFKKPGGGIIYDYVDVEIDEEVLQKISAETGAKYYRATNNEALRNIYTEIDLLEKTKIEVSRLTRYKEEFHIFALSGVALFLLELLLGLTIFRKIP